MGGLISLWESFLSTRSEKTREAYNDGLSMFLKANGYDSPERAISELKKKKAADEAIAAFILFMKEKRMAPSSMALYLSAVKNFLTLYDIPFNAVKIKAMRPRKKFIRELRPLPKEDLVKVLPFLRPVKKLFIWFLFATGCRAGEAAQLRIKDLHLNLDPPRAEVVNEKSSGKRVVFIPGDLAAELKRWVEGKRPEDFVFHSERGPEHPLDINHARAAFQSVLRRILYMKRDPSNRGWQYGLHSLRKTFKTLMQNSGMDGLMIEVLLGHSTGLDRHYYLPSLEELAREWKKHERVLRLDTLAYNEEVQKRMREIYGELERMRGALEIYVDIVKQIKTQFPQLYPLLRDAERKMRKFLEKDERAF